MFFYVALPLGAQMKSYCVLKEYAISGSTWEYYDSVANVARPPSCTIIYGSATLFPS